MNRLHRAAVDLQEVARDAGWGYCFIGGLVVPRWGIERTTRDVDVTILTNFVEDESCIARLLARFESRIPNAREFALRARVLLLRHENGVELDIALGALDFEVRSVERASRWKASQGVELFTCSADDLVVHKAFAARDRDWADVDSILSVQRDRLNVAQIREELGTLAALKEDLSVVARLESMFRSHGLG